MAAMVRAQALRGYRPLVRELGGDAARLLRSAKIQGAAFDQPDSFISFDGVVQLLERSARDLACPDFGLRLAARQDIGILGPLAVAMRSSATVGEAMRCASKYIYAYNAAIGFSVRADNGDHHAVFDFDVVAGQGPQRGQTIEHGVGITWRIVSMLSAGRSHLNRVWLPHPALASRASYRGHLGAPVEFGAPLAALAIDRGDLDLPLGEHNEELHALAVDYLKVQFPARPTSTCHSGAQGDRTAVGHGGMRLRRSGRRSRDAPANAATAAAGRGHLLRGHQGRSPTGSCPAVSGPPRGASHAGHRPARLRRTVGPDQKLSALVPDDAPGAPVGPRVRHGGRRARVNCRPAMNPSSSAAAGWAHHA